MSEVVEGRREIGQAWEQAIQAEVGVFGVDHFYMLYDDFGVVAGFAASRIVALVHFVFRLVAGLLEKAVVAWSR